MSAEAEVEVVWRVYYSRYHGLSNGSWLVRFTTERGAGCPPFGGAWADSAVESAKTVAREVAESLGTVVRIYDKQNRVIESKRYPKAYQLKLI